MNIWLQNKADRIRFLAMMNAVQAALKPKKKSRPTGNIINKAWLMCALLGSLQKTTVQACKYQSLDKGKANSCTLFHSNIQPLMVELWSKIACTLILNNLFCLSCFNALKWAFYNHFCLIWHIEALDASYLASCCSMTLCIRFNNIISIKNISTNDNEVKVRNTTKRCCSKKGKIRR